MPYNVGGNTTVGQVDFLKRQVESLPPNYLDYRSLWEQVFLPSAEYLAFVYTYWTTLYTYLDPATAPEDWIDWMLGEWWGWRLIPQSYPLSRKRRLLANLHAHYKRRGTVNRSIVTYDTEADMLADPNSGAGIRLLLLEFGIRAVVTDQPAYWGGFYGRYAVDRWPLHTRVVVESFDAWDFPLNTYYGNYWGGQYYHQARQIVSEAFVVSLCQWSRPFSTQFRIEFPAGNVIMTPIAPVLEDEL